MEDETPTPGKKPGESNAEYTARTRDERGKKGTTSEIDPLTGKAKPLKDYDPNAPKPKPTPSPTPTPAPDPDMPKMENYPGLAGRAAYNKAMKEYEAKKAAKKAGQVKAQVNP